MESDWVKPNKTQSDNTCTGSSAILIQNHYNVQTCRLTTKNQKTQPISSTYYYQTIICCPYF